jgi:hypothetical protein
VTTREGIIKDLLVRQAAGDEGLGPTHPDTFGGAVKTQAEIAEYWRVSTSTVNKMAIDLEHRQKAKLDIYNFD